MKRRLRRLTVFGGVVGLVMALNVGTAFAGNTGPPTQWDCNSYDLNVGAENLACGDDPADIINSGGTAVKEQTLGPILFGPAGASSGQFRGIDRNPFCLLHDSDTPTPAP